MHTVSVTEILSGLPATKASSCQAPQAMPSSFPKPQFFAGKKMSKGVGVTMQLALETACSFSHLQDLAECTIINWDRFP